eukprot:Sdes_comp20028_c0_seq1m12784
MFLALATTAACIIGLADNHWATGHLNGTSVHYGLGSECQPSSTSSLAACSTHLHWSSLDHYQKAMIALMIIAAVFGAICFALEILSCVTCCCNRSLLHYASLAIFIQFLCMTATLFIFPSTYGLNYNYPSGVDPGWTMWVVVGGAGLAGISSALNLKIHRHRSQRDSTPPKQG